MLKKHKWLFWVLAAATFAFAAVPSIVILKTATDYYQFLTGFTPDTLKPTKVDFVAHGRIPDRDDETTEIEFIPFRLRAAGAKKVELLGDFNAWRPKTLPLQRSGKRDWEVWLPLPAGKYLYLFLVDGKTRLDPNNKRTDEYKGRPASVLEVK